MAMTSARSSRVVSLRAVLWPIFILSATGHWVIRSSLTTNNSLARSLNEAASDSLMMMKVNSRGHWTHLVHSGTFSWSLEGFFHPGTSPWSLRGLLSGFCHSGTLPLAYGGVSSRDLVHSGTLSWSLRGFCHSETLSMVTKGLVPGIQSILERLGGLLRGFTSWNILHLV